MNTGSRRLRFALLAFMLPAILLAAGCKPRLRYNTKTRAPLVYQRTVYNGGTDGQGNPYFEDTPAGTINIIVDPYMERSGNVWMKVTTPTLTGRSTVYKDKNLGQEQILLTAQGNIMERKMQNNTFSMYDLFFDLPKRRIKPGDTWTSQQFHEVHRTIAIKKSLAGEGQYFPLDYEKSLPVKYTYLEKVKCGKSKCARLSVNAAYEEVIQQEGVPIFAILSYSRTGTVDFNIKAGMPHSAEYDEVFYKQIVDSYTEDVLMEVNDVNKIEYALQKQ
jgi:hypothetical protein